MRQEELLARISGAQGPSLSLAGHNLGAKTGAELAQAFTAIPNSVTSLYLNGNNLGTKTGAELAQAFAAIPHSVTSLDLSENRLSAKTSAELAQAFAAIPHSVRTINLAGNNLGWIGTVEEVGDLLLKMGRRIILGDTQFEQALERYMLRVYQQQAAQLVNSEASQIRIDCLSLVDEFLTGATASISMERVRAAKMEQGQIGAKERENNSTSPQTDPNSTSTAPLQVTAQRDSTPVRRPSDYLSNGEEGEVVEEKSSEAWERTQRNRRCFSFNEPHQYSPNNTYPRAKESNFGASQASTDLTTSSSRLTRVPVLTNTTPTDEPQQICPQIVFGFMAVAGVVAIAVAFIFLNAATLGTAGLVTASAGTVSLLVGGIGLFNTRSNDGNSHQSPGEGIGEPLLGPLTA